MQPRAYITLSKKNLLHNFEVIKNYAKDAAIVSMVKSNAYGHGILAVSRYLKDHTDVFGVRSLKEALTLIKGRITTRILICQGVRSPYELAQASLYKCEIVIYTQEHILWLLSLTLANPVICWIKINTGMRRLGFDPEKLEAVYHQLQGHKNIQEIIIMSHFACADEKEHFLNNEQITTFNNYTNNYSAARSICNSAALFNFPNVHYQYVRPGIALYGVSPFKDKTANDLGLLPVMNFYSSLLSVQMFKRGSSVGYGALYTCPEDMPVGIVGCGYADGYPITVSSGAYVIIKDTLCPIIGRISMDMIAVDLRSISYVNMNEPVLLWGAELPLEILAFYTMQTTYSILTGMAQRVISRWVS